jgi:hypothetical protein
MGGLPLAVCSLLFVGLVVIRTFIARSKRPTAVKAGKKRRPKMTETAALQLQEKVLMSFAQVVSDFGTDVLAATAWRVEPTGWAISRATA